MSGVTIDEFSVVLSTYHGDDAGDLATALESVFDQTRTPNEVVLVADGPLRPEQNGVVDRFDERYDWFRLHQIDENTGRGEARRVGVETASHDVVAMMDADDVCRPHRFETQIAYLESHPDVDIVGSYHTEFSESPDDPHAVRTVPTDHEEIVSRARHRSPMNQVTVMFHKQAVLDAGNYRNVDRMEDYGLWVRMVQNGARFANIPEPLVDVRAGKSMYSRRGGLEYAREEIRVQREFFDRGFTTGPQFLFNLVTRVPIRLVPGFIRGFVYARLFRK